MTMLFDCIFIFILIVVGNFDAHRRRFDGIAKRESADPDGRIQRLEQVVGLRAGSLGELRTLLGDSQNAARGAAFWWQWAG
jgi:hypothetical protein